VSWFILLVLLTWSLAHSWFPEFFPAWSTGIYWITAFISTLLLFVAVLLHEMAHVLVARAHGIPARGITLHVFGGVADIGQDAKRPGIEFHIAIAGPIASFLIAVLAYVLVLPLRGSNSSAEAVLEYLMISNLILGLFNLVPGFPLDGGCVLRSILWKVTHSYQRATRFASMAGQGCGFLFILLGIVSFFTGSFFTGLWIVFIGWFLLSTAQATNTEVMLHSSLEGVAAKHVMDPYPLTVPANISLQKMVDDYFLPRGIRTAPVLQGDYLAGLITLQELNRVPHDRWAYTPIGHVMRLTDQIYVAAPEQPLHEILQQMVSRNINQVPVTQDGHLMGLVNRESIIRYLNTLPAKPSSTKYG
jgi:Zn-dependent protease/CBS domain-containing protein